MPFLYSLFWYLALPFALLRLWLRGKREPGYREHIPERFGFYRGKPNAPMIWVHAVSAGETRAAEPLIRALLARYPDHHLLLSHMTATGRSTGGVLFKDVQERITQVFLPYDVKPFINRFLRHFSPRICILMETEVWPNLIARCQRLGVPTALVNARLSEKSFKKALRLPSLILPTAKAISVVAAQSKSDAERLAALGAQDVTITGNIKFDVVAPANALQNGLLLRQKIGARSVLLCASTRDGEEALILNAYAKTLASRKDILLIITPRHPQRFDEVATLLDQMQLSYVRRSAINIEDEQRIFEDTQVILGDSMGEMYMYYAASDIAFIGGSLAPLGGHNLIEACAMGKPVLTATHTFNFAEVTEQALAANAAIRVQDADDLMRQSAQLIAAPDTLQNMGNNAHAYFLQHQGATDRTMQVISKFL
jgi:3-deoxy-D-manno-octulosonic-acid transferase